MSEIQQDLLNDVIPQLKPAVSIGKRIVAALIDSIILAIVLVVMFKFFGERYTDTESVTTTIHNVGDATGTTSKSEVITSSGYHLTGWPAFICMVAWFFLMPFLEGKSGQTIGKRALRIEVVHSNGNKINVGASFVRHLFDIIDCFFLVGLIVAATNSQRKRIGDLVANTYVVDKDGKTA